MNGLNPDFFLNFLKLAQIPHTQFDTLCAFVVFDRILR